MQEPVISLAELDALIASKIAAEALRTHLQAERAYAELIAASREARPTRLRPSLTRSRSP